MVLPGPAVNVAPVGSPDAVSELIVSSSGSAAVTLTEIGTNLYRNGQHWAQFVVDQLGGKGNIVQMNGIPGVAFGWLYWQRGLEAAMVAHFSADLVLHVLIGG